MELERNLSKTELNLNKSKIFTYRGILRTILIIKQLFQKWAILNIFVHVN